MSTTAPAPALNVPVLICAFSRHGTTKQVFDAVRKARPTRLYFACDGGRNPEEWEKCRKVRSLVDTVDWPCEVHTLFHERNMGSKYGMAANFDWFFAAEPEGIILEDDVIPAQSFFRFAAELLERYRDEERIWAIIGNNLMTGGRVEGANSYWFNGHGYGAYWGWAGWRRSWSKVDLELKEWPEVRDKDLFKDYFLSKGERAEAYNLFQAVWDNTLSAAWDYQFEFAKIKAGAVNIIPNVNLCRNVGFGGEGTHTVNVNDKRNQEHLHEAEFPLVHPERIAIDPKKDLMYFNTYLRTPWFVRLKTRIRERLPDGLRKRLVGLVSDAKRRMGLR